MRVRVVALLEIVGSFAGLFLAAALIGGLVLPLLPESARTPVQALGLWGAVIAGGLLLKRGGTSYRALGLRRPKSWRATLGWTSAAILLSSAGAALLGALIQAATDWPPLDVAYIRRSIEGDLVAYLLWIVLVVWGSAAFGEELFARGFLTDRLRILFGGGRGALFAAMVGQAALFGALHTVQGPSGIVITFYVGLVFAGIWYASGRNLWAPILAHGLMDTMSLTLMFLGQPLPGYID
jgi:hypothetical protein